MLSITIPGLVQPSTVAEAMEVELETWLGLYPIPLLVSAFDNKEDLIDLEDTRPSSHLMGYMEAKHGTVAKFWRTLKDEEIPSEPMTNEYLLRVYKGVSVKTSSQIQGENWKKTEREIHQNRQGRRVLYIWLFVLPGLWAIWEWAAPAWYGSITLCYALGKTLIATLKLSGKWKESPQECKDREEELQKKHHHYHCKLNPDGFARLRAENFEREGSGTGSQRGKNAEGTNGKTVSAEFRTLSDSKVSY